MRGPPAGLAARAGRKPGPSLQLDTKNTKYTKEETFVSFVPFVFDVLGIAAQLRQRHALHAQSPIHNRKSGYLTRAGESELLRGAM